jgi:hypothetical protein
MGLKDKLKDLLNKVESGAAAEADIAEELEGLSVLVEEEEEEEAYEAPKNLNLDWEEVRDIYNLQAQLKIISEAIGALVIRFEATKASMLKAREENLARTKGEIDRIRMDFGLPDNANYTLNLPEKEGDTGSFVLDEDQPEDS